MTLEQIMTELAANGSDSIKKVLLKHGVKEPFFGVKVEFLKTIQKKIKKDYVLSKALFATGNADAMYLAGLIADDEKMTKAELQHWVEMAVSNNISEYTVPWVAAGNRFGWELGLDWINSPVDHISASGWATLGNWVALKPDTELDMDQLRQLLTRVEHDIHRSGNRTTHLMNGFIIHVGTYVTALTEEAVRTAEKIGKVTVDMNGTACKVPDAREYIGKSISKGQAGKKKKNVKC